MEKKKISMSFGIKKKTPDEDKDAKQPVKVAPVKIALGAQVNIYIY